MCRHLTTAALPGHAAPRSRGSARRRLWDLPPKLHCPVIGTCLPADELRRLASRTDHAVLVDSSDYDVHVAFVAAADTRGPLSVAAHKCLQRRFTHALRQVRALRDSNALGAFWCSALARGDIAGALWAVLTHAACDDALEARVFGDVHMLSHQTGAGQRADLQRLAAREAEIATLKRDIVVQFQRQRRALADREQRVATLEARLAERQQLQQRLRDDNHRLQQALSMQQADDLACRVRQLEHQLAHALHERDAWRTAQQSASERVDDLTQRLAEQCADRESLPQPLAQSLSDCDNCDHKACEQAPDLRGRRILCVGGRRRLIEQYRDLVARCNGEFEHHDGGVEHSRQRLDSLLSAADAVLCATDCVSHDAYHRCKRFCKRNAKPHAFLRRSGLSTFTRALIRVSG
ncbi:MAG: DUF2325 domain-containing protein [Gammaproteobacteria bacterium]|nr:DUF2325 domain-containing protein [Gammaproteobacteria bacterium]MCB1926202.1 DUF2325 domain-containing protein [Gammaproteobacteria bacterium]